MAWRLAGTGQELVTSSGRGHRRTPPVRRRERHPPCPRSAGGCGGTGKDTAAPGLGLATLRFGRKRRDDPVTRRSLFACHTPDPRPRVLQDRASPEPEQTSSKINPSEPRTGDGGVQASALPDSAPTASSAGADGDRRDHFSSLEQPQAKRSFSRGGIMPKRRRPQ